jgi:hypothetical protein
MTPLFHLFLAHFLSDYPLQPSGLVKLKNKSFWGVLIHSAIHLAALIIIMLPFLYVRNLLIGIGIIFVTHSVIDWSRISFEKKYKYLKLPLYFLDQVLHLLIIALIAYWVGVPAPKLPAGWMWFYADRSVVVYILILILVTYFYDVTRHFLLTRKKPKPYVRDYRMMLRNVFIVSIAFAVYWMTY